MRSQKLIAQLAAGGRSSMTGTGKRVGIIGGGAAGVISARWLREAGHSVVVFEKAATVGGVWRYTDESHCDASMYKSLRTNLPTAIMQLPGVSFAPGTRSFPSHSAVLQYIQDYASHFNVNEVIRLNTTVTSVRKSTERDAWTISVATVNGEAHDETFDKVLVCNGHFAKPFSSPIKGIEHFKGLALHSHDYRTPDAFLDKSVLVIGRGPSGQDISLELSRISKREVIVSSREYDEDVALGKAIPTSPEDKRTLKPSIDHIAVDGSVVFVDGSTLPAPDVLMYATGYLYSVSDFLPSDLLYPKAPQASAIATLEGELHDELKQAAEEKHLLAPIYKQVFAIENPDVAFIGLPFSNLPFLCFELQSRWIARVFHDASLLPSKQEMYDTYRAQLETLPWPVDSLHKLGPTQPDYFAEIASFSDAKVDPLVLEMFADAGYLRLHYPFDYRESEFFVDQSTGKWTRQLKLHGEEHVRVFG